MGCPLQGEVRCCCSLASGESPQSSPKQSRVHADQLPAERKTCEFQKRWGLVLHTPACWLFPRGLTRWPTHFPFFKNSRGFTNDLPTLPCLNTLDTILCRREARAKYRGRVLVASACLAGPPRPLSCALCEGSGGLLQQRQAPLSCEASHARRWHTRGGHPTATKAFWCLRPAARVSLYYRVRRLALSSYSCPTGCAPRPRPEPESCTAPHGPCTVLSAPGHKPPASRSNTSRSHLMSAQSYPTTLHTPQQLHHPAKMSNSLFSQHTRLSEEVFARFMSLPQGEAYQAEYICKSKGREGGIGRASKAAGGTQELPLKDVGRGGGT